MADECDRASELQLQLEANALAKHKSAVAQIPEGVAGVCEWCDHFFERTVNGACGKCRDTFKLDGR